MGRFVRIAPPTQARRLFAPDRRLPMSKFVRWCAYLIAFLASISVVREIARPVVETYERVSETLALILVLGSVTFLFVGIAELIAWTVRRG